ncbi:nucleotidyl transferase AbiEii/AbiGii toxin family protein [Kocuria sp.]|uniref:nucleotidyl transferase AbiEii/AbiGii toxin family protein n=1 Tax=Kocuria sp. TaxID=1871328 RepID=UPI0026DC79BC|nr:nucleotidyl transferase AbiEii/AbiGii toxin family protein [Kocuria sp.]MDO4919153.1 nucleotidyl transferase AbiEii/AbiGii toxin family protein [Kocuria sp.]
MEAIIRQFVVDRFLARVFSSSPAEWVLKGGNAVLSRVHDARATKDVDLLVGLTNLEDAVARLRTAVAVDLGDHFRFIVTEARVASGGTLQSGVEGCKVSVDAYCGVTRRHRFSVDLVVFARTQYIDGPELSRAIAAEWAHRGLPGSPFFAPPHTWDRLYPAAARRVPACGDVLTFHAALELTAAFLDPVLEHFV